MRYICMNERHKWEKNIEQLFIFDHKIVELIKQKRFIYDGGGPGGNGGFCDDCAYIWYAGGYIGGGGYDVIWL